MLAQMDGNSRCSFGEDLLPAREHRRVTHFSSLFHYFPRHWLLACFVGGQSLAMVHPGLLETQVEAPQKRRGHPVVNKQQERARSLRKRAGFTCPVSPMPRTGQGEAGRWRKGAPEQNQLLREETSFPVQGMQIEGRAREVLTIREGKGKVRNLDVIVGIPVRIINNNCVGCSKVYAQTASTGREEKAELLSTRS